MSINLRYPGQSATKQMGGGDEINQPRIAIPTNFARQEPTGYHHRTSSPSRRLARSSSPSAMRLATQSRRAASPVAVALYLQQQKRPTNTTTVALTAAAAEEGMAGNAVELKRQNILQENQKAALVRLNDPANVSTSEGGMGTGWNTKSTSTPLDSSPKSKPFEGIALLRQKRFSPTRSSSAGRSIVTAPVTNKKMATHRPNTNVAIHFIPSTILTSKL